MLTVRELIRDLEVRVVAGERGLDLPVRWVHISELDDPTPWLSGGELLLTTGMQLDAAEQQRDFLTRLADHQLAGLGFGSGFKHATVPAPLIECADERDFPVFEVPYEVPFIAVTESAFTQLVNEQYAVLRRALAAHERLQRIVLSERGLEPLVASLSTLTGAAVVVLDARGEPLMHRAFRRELRPETLVALQADVRERARRKEARAFAPACEAGTQAMALPVAAGDAPQNGGSSAAFRLPQAWLVVFKEAGSLSDFDRLTLHQAVTIVALELLRERVAGDTERRLAGDVLEGMVRGELAGPELTRRLAPFGVGERAAAIVAQRAAGSGGRGGSGSLEAAMRTALRDEAVPGLVASTDAFSCALVRGLPDEDLLALAERIAEVVSAGPDSASPEGSGSGDVVRIGVGRALPSGEARRSYNEARCAVEALTLSPAAANGAGRAPHIATYKQLGSFQLLLSLQDDEALSLFCDSILGPIEASEGHYGGELMRSLEAFIEENGQWERAARRLYCHRHTLRYRIRRVEELTGRNLGSARDRIEFWLALRGRELVR